MQVEPPVAATLTQALEDSARLFPQRGIGVYDRRGQNCEFRAYPQILEAAQDRAARLAAAGIGRGDRVLVCLPTSWDLLEIWFGALLRGAYPVLLAPPGALGGAAAHARKVETLLGVLSPKRFICDGNTRKELADFKAPEALAASLTPEELLALPPAPGDALYRPAPDDIAFMQLTSGSTGRQRAVIIPHRCVIHNTTASYKFVDGLAGGREHRVASWLPLNHDMGLVGCLLFGVAHRLNIWLLRPESFLARPWLWPQLVSRHQCTESPGPNFAFQLCVERIDPKEIASLDLTSWTGALTGAEMVQPETCRAFCDKFAGAKFHASQLVPSYGMAETTLAVAADGKRLGVRTAAVPGATGGDAGPTLPRVVCVGAPLTDTEVRISAPGSAARFLGEGAIGEVCVKGPGVFAGYYNDAAATADALKEGWLHTGDLGFMQDGELYITGRIKDLLIIHGHNLMPHELEWVAESVTGGGGTERCGAFSITRGAAGEEAVLIMEAGETDGAKLSALGREVRVRIGQALGLPLAEVVFVKRGQIPKTTSGKVQRGELRQRYLDGRIERLGGG